MYRSCGVQLLHEVDWLGEVECCRHFSIEDTCLARSLIVFVRNYWTYGFLVSAIYVALVFLVERVMRNRKPLKLKGLLIVWNLLLAVSSAIMFSRLFCEFVDAITKGGIYGSVCYSRETSNMHGLWSFIFTALKIPELLDTAFIILRKRKLIFLHWYHHAVTMLYCLYSLQSNSSTGRWFQTVNSFIHALMYSYYALRAMDITVPKSISMTLTLLQISQMAVGCTINYLVIKYKSAGLMCDVSNGNTIASVLMYFSFFVLFSKFFYDSYMKNQRSKNIKKVN